MDELLQSRVGQLKKIDEDLERIALGWDARNPAVAAIQRYRSLELAEAIRDAEAEHANF